MRQHLSPIVNSLTSVFRLSTRPSTFQQPGLLSQTCKNTLAPGSIISSVNAFRPFSSSSTLQAKKAPVKLDRRVTLIRYFLNHPLTPRPLHFSRNRYLRHWTIHRAWQLYTAKQRRAHQLELERQWASMKDACEELRTGVGDGGRLFRTSMNKRGVFSDGIPIEYGRLQTDSPSKDGWDYSWKP
ncbi:hypothetical protein TESG_02505 [Trichophyton tonsurans CBS 112818]|uniref:Uncharacterized protein n=1 Tax=Trichophyton tonsurans (strain CBS 112818) TaxID=647933 RepID=F2RUL2_TRIT1|nr:hypothetical protein TESG_02505 [Trichophyton tonsurans CBS 112818]